MPEPEEKDPAQAFQNRLKKYDGDAMQFATQLFDENFQLRNKNRDLEAKVPKDGAVVLSKADADRFEAFKALNLKPEDIKAKVEASDTLAAEVASLKKKDTLRDVASAAGFKLSVLEDRDKASGGLEYTLKEEKDKAGEKRKVAYVKHEGKEVPLEQFANEQWADFVPALKEASGQGQAKRGNGGDPPPAGSQNTYDRIREDVKNTAPQAGGMEWLKNRFGQSASNA